MAVYSRWLIIQLNDSIDLPEYREIEAAVQEVFGTDADYFIPIHYQKIGTYVSNSTLIPGYIFIKDTEKAREMLSSMGNSRVLVGALVLDNKIQTVSSVVIAGLRRRLRSSIKKNLRAGTKVRVCGGALKNLIGEVVSMEDDGHKVMVRISRLSRDILAPIPATLVEVCDCYQKSEKT